MKKLLIPLAAFLVMAGSSAGWAWSHVEGSITSIDPNQHQLALDNGQTYTVRPSVNLSKLAVGDKVTVNAETTKSGKHIVNKVTKSG